ncbi:CARDB domain-containing protein, partial [Hyalangium sp.]|uniref:CARDB domain-containing protein n=1 Tax=Hyalangium sp. TaxID=2028555 RepID=UPI002D5FA617
LEGTIFIADEGQDLVVTALTTPPSVESGQAFPVTATVCNQGTQPSPGATLTLRYSADALLTPYDLLAGSASVGPLPVGECFSVSLQPSAPPSGLWRPGAFVSAQGSGELREDNNTFVGAPLAVGHAPDLTVTELRVPETVSRFTQVPVDLTVCNQGTAPSDSTSVELLFSTDTVLGVADVAAGSAALPALPAGECTTFRMKASVHADNGPWYFGAQLVQSGFEPRLDNNGRVVETVVGEGKDLVVSSVSAFMDPWWGVSATVTVCNQGSQPSSGGNVDVFYSDPNLVPSSYPLAAAGLPDLAPGECTTQSMPGEFPPSMDPYMDPFVLGARVSGTCCGPEVREDNDTRMDGHQRFSSYGSDLVITGIQAPVSVLPGEPLTAEVTVCSVFPTYSPMGSDVTLELFLSQDGVLDAGDLPASSTVLSLDQSNHCHTASMSLNAPQGVWTLLGRVTSSYDLDDLYGGNNVTAGKRLAIGNAADLTVTQVSTRAAVLAGSPFAVTTTVCNQGTAASVPVALGFFLSFDEHATQGELSAGTAQVPALTPGNCTEVVGSASAPSASTLPYRRLVALVDPSRSLPELREDNNDMGGDWLGVGSGPELVITTVTGPAAVLPEGPFQVLVTVCNEGSQAVSGVELAVVFSADTTITASDTRVGASTLSVGPGACTTVEVPAVSERFEIRWTLGAIIDPADSVSELIELNNTRAGSSLAVGYQPDFAISHVTAPAQVSSGASFTADVEVCNQGTVWSNSEVTIVFSTDDTFTLDDVVAGSESYFELEPGQCVTVSVPGVAYPGAGTYQLGAIVDGNLNQPEFSKANNTGSGGSVDIL